MNKRWRLAGGAVVVIALLGLGLWLARGPIAMAVMRRAYARNLASDPLGALPDGLSVGLCGAGSPMPDPTRAGPCEAVVAGKRLFVIDAGEGSVKNLALMRLPPGQVSAVFLTHYHSDHIADLGELMLQRWAGNAASSPLPIYGPTGLGQVVGGFEQAYQLDRGYRIAHHGPVVFPPSGFGASVHEFTAPRAGGDVTLIDDGSLKVVAFPVDHEPVEPAVGYAFSYRGRKVVISGDTRLSPRVQAEAAGADVLVHEGLAPKLVAMMRAAALKHRRTNLAAILRDILTYHTTPEQAASIAARDKVGLLLFTHIIPPLPFAALESAWLGRAGAIFPGRIRVGHDGDFVTLPAGRGEPRLTNRLTNLLRG